MNVRTRSCSALTSFDGNWVISSSKSQPQGVYAVAKSNGKVEFCQQRKDERNNSEDSRDFQMSPLRIDGHQHQKDYTAKRLNKVTQSNKSYSIRSESFKRNGEKFRKPVPREVILYKFDGEFGFSMRQISSAMYGRQPLSAFIPTDKVPALQRLNVIDPGGLADSAGLRPGDYVLEVNDECVTCSPHQYVVHLIKNSPEALKMKVVEGVEETMSYTANSTPKKNKVEYKKPDYLQTVILPRNAQKLIQRRKRVGKVSQLNACEAGTKIFTSSNYSSKLSNSSVTNIRLSSFLDHDRIYYEPRENKSLTDIDAVLRSQVPVLPSSTSQSSSGSLTSQSKALDWNLHHQKASSVSEENRNILEPKVVEPEIANKNTLCMDDDKHTYDKVRPPNVSFDTDEGFIRLGGNVDYVAHIIEEQDKVDFLVLAEKVRQMYLKKKLENEQLKL